VLQFDSIGIMLNHQYMKRDRILNTSNYIEIFSQLFAYITYMENTNVFRWYRCVSLPSDSCL